MRQNPADTFSRRLAACALAVLLLLLAVRDASARTGTDAAPRAKYVFLFIGDGMGLAQRYAAELYLAALHDQPEPGPAKLVMGSLPVQGLTTTFSAESAITDSAAAGTALACGVKTNNASLGVDSRGAPVKSVAEMAKDKGMRVGIVTTVSLDHATPAVFYAHVPSRKDYHEIAMAMPTSGFDYFAGGGFLDPEARKAKAGGAVPEVESSLVAAGYRVARTEEEFAALGPGAGKTVFIHPTLKEGEAMNFSIDAAPGEIALKDLTAKGIEILDNPRGFFMMVEGGKIDWACHANDAMTAIGDVLALDRAVAEALAFYAGHPNDTLIVVTGDHETGGMAIGYSGTGYETHLDRLRGQKSSYSAFAGRVREYRQTHGADARFEDMIPLIRESFGLIAAPPEEMETLVRADAGAGGRKAKSRDAFGMTLRDYELGELRDAFARSMTGEKDHDRRGHAYLLYGSDDPFTVALTRVLGHKAGIAWTTFVHSGAPVVTSAVGVGSSGFTGSYDNTDIFRKLRAVMGLETQAVQ